MGPTPAIVARYGTGTVSDFNGWPNDFGDLVNVIYLNSSSIKVIDFKLTADPGSAVGLHSFQMAAWTHDYAIVSVKVLNESNAQLYSQGNVFIQGDAVGPPHTDFIFGSPLVGQSITIRIDATNLGPSFVNIGLDNVVFSQVPEPASIGASALRHYHGGSAGNLLIDDWVVSRTNLRGRECVLRSVPPRSCRETILSQPRDKRTTP